MPFYYKYDPSFVEIGGFVHPNTSVYFDMRFVCVGCFVEKSRKKRHITIRKTSSMLMEGLFPRTFSLASLCALCVVCFLKQMREKSHITLRTTPRLL